MALAQPKAWRRHSALMLMALGIGAGLRAGEITVATTADVHGRTASLRVGVGGALARTVRVQPDSAALLVALARARPTALFCSIARRSIAATTTSSTTSAASWSAIRRHPCSRPIAAGVASSATISPPARLCRCCLQMSGIKEVESLLALRPSCRRGAAFEGCAAGAAQERSP